MQALIEKLNAEGPHQIIQNSDSLYKQPNEWIQDIKYEEPNEYEKNLIKDTKTASQLLESELEQETYTTKRDLINKVKVVALARMGCYPLTNPSFFSKQDKSKLISLMELVLNLPNDKLTKEFNEVCTDKIFTEKSDYSQFPIYN